MCLNDPGNEQQAGGARSMEVVTLDDLAQLGRIARSDREFMFQQNPRWGEYQDRVLCVALCQGAGLHFLDQRTGVKDFDVWTFFARTDQRPQPDPALYRRIKAADFGVSRFGRTPNSPRWIQGRRIDLLARSLDVEPSLDPVEVIRRWLDKGRTSSARKLASKAVIMIEPVPGTVAWPR
jgi:hypothetical protein